MKAIISTTYDDLYLFFLPLTVWAWGKLGVETICFMPFENTNDDVPTKIKQHKLSLIDKTISEFGGKCQIPMFYMPENKQATAAQISRLFASNLQGIKGGNILITGDIDMLVFNIDFIKFNEFGKLSILGVDLVPHGQMPMCYAFGMANDWDSLFNKGRSYQKCLDDELGNEECENMKGNFWSRDQELLARYIGNDYLGHQRSNGQNQFAKNRIDRTDLHWRERLTHDVIDAHLWRPGYTDDNFSKILELLTYFYPQDNFEWLQTYRSEYLKLL